MRLWPLPAPVDFQILLWNRLDVVLTTGVLVILIGVACANLPRRPRPAGLLLRAIGLTLFADLVVNPAEWTALPIVIRLLPAPIQSPNLIRYAVRAASCLAELALRGFAWWLVIRACEDERLPPPAPSGSETRWQALVVPWGMIPSVSHSGRLLILAAAGLIILQRNLPWRKSRLLLIAALLSALPHLCWLLPDMDLIAGHWLITGPPDLAVPQVQRYLAWQLFQASAEIAAWLLITRATLLPPDQPPSPAPP